jgi:hypothetical protein
MIGDGVISPDDGSGDLDPSIALDGEGNPVVAWGTASLGTQIQRWTGSEWVWVSGPEGRWREYDFTCDTQVSVRPDGSIMAMWCENWGSMGYMVLADLWDGSEWISLDECGTGDFSESGGPPHPTPVLVSGDNFSLALYYQTCGGIHVRTSDGTGWREVGLGSASGSGAAVGYCGRYSGHDLAVDSDGHLYLVWTQDGREIYLRSTRPELQVPGNANGDSVLDAADIVRLIDHVQGNKPITFTPSLDTADTDCDGDVDMDDVDALIELLLGVPGD